MQLQLELLAQNKSSASEIYGQVQFGTSVGPLDTARGLQKSKVLKIQQCHQTELNQSHIDHMILLKLELVK